VESAYAPHIVCLGPLGSLPQRSDGFREASAITLCYIDTGERLFASQDIDGVLAAG
jgi:hypothetical protein